MSVDVIRSAQEAPELVSQRETTSEAIIETEEEMRAALLEALNDIPSGAPAPRSPQEPTDVEQGIVELLNVLRKAA